MNLIVDVTAERYGDGARTRARRAAERAGYRLVHATHPEGRLAAWIDWHFAPSWWSSEVRAGKAWYAVDAAGDIAGFAAYDVTGMAFPWLRPYRERPELGVFGPYGVAPEHRKRGVGIALLDAALAELRAAGYETALIPAVNGERLIAAYRERTGAVVADAFTTETARRFRTVILASGNGTNAQSVFEGVAAGRLPLELTGVVVNAADAGVTARAEAAGVRAHTVVWDRAGETRPAFDARVMAAVAEQAPELVLLLGWMHLLAPAFIERFPELINVHPAFLPLDPSADDVAMPDGSVIPALRGARALRHALAAELAWSGASVHRVTNETDRGAILVRTPLSLAGIRDEGALADRLRPLEHAAVASAIRRWAFEQA